MRRIRLIQTRAAGEFKSVLQRSLGLLVPTSPEKSIVPNRRHLLLQQQMAKNLEKKQNVNSKSKTLRRPRDHPRQVEDLM